MLWAKVDGNQLVMEIQEEENAGWGLIPSGAIKMTGEEKRRPCFDLSKK